MSVNIITEAKTLRINASGSATGNIWLEVNGTQFPMHGWNDFLVVLVGWWLKAMLRLIGGNSIQENVPFMDGPFTVEVTMKLPGLLRFRALQGANRESESAVGEERTEDFIIRLIAQAKGVLSACELQGFYSEDVKNLRFFLVELESKMNRRIGQ